MSSSDRSNHSNRSEVRRDATGRLASNDRPRAMAESATPAWVARAPLPPCAPSTAHDIAIDYRSAFDLAPIGLALSRRRVIVDCNQALLVMFGATREELVGQSFRVLYPGDGEFERTGQRISETVDVHGRYADDRIMRRLDGEMFWCHVSGRAFDPEDPHASGMWTFEDLSAKRRVDPRFTGREREIATLLMEGLTSKRIGERLGMSPRTVDVYRSRMMRKMGAATTPEMVTLLMSG